MNTNILQSIALNTKFKNSCTVNRLTHSVKTFECHSNALYYAYDISYLLELVRRLAKVYGLDKKTSIAYLNVHVCYSYYNCYYTPQKNKWDWLKS